MALAAGSKLGPYEILAPLGAGGMGEVYRARDARLGRDVAIKVLPAALAGNADARQRFEREARAVSSLNHPNICTLHDVGEQDGVHYLVMELLEGETLQARLTRGPLPPEDTLRIAAALAAALDSAHRQGVLHRDLKPANVMLTKAGPKLLDFGLAKGVAQQGLASQLTMTSPLTTAGTLVGTFQYMSPEQLEGHEADARSDLFAFGAILYEIATGRRAFEGATSASVIAAILKEHPRPISEVRPLSPPALDRVVARCLQKDPDDRWQTARDLKSEIEWILGTSAGTSAAAVATAPVIVRRARPAWQVAAGAIVLAAVMLALGWTLHAPPPEAPAPTLRTSVLLPPGTNLDSQNSSLALSPDGTRLAFVASGPDGAPGRLWVRPLDSLTAQPLAGTEEASYPTWSPDGRSLAFFANRKLRKVPAAGGTVQAIADANEGRGASWGPDGTIVFAPEPFGGLLQVGAAGGAPAPTTTVEVGSLTDRNPRFLPDGRRVLFVRQGGNDEQNGIHVVDLSSKEVRRIAAEASEGLYLDPGRLAFVRENVLLVQTVDPATLAATGEAVPVTDRVQFNPYRFTGAYAFGPGGLLLYRAADQIRTSRLTLFDLDGTEQGTVGEPAQFEHLRIAPDGRRAVSAVRNAEGRLELWMHDLVRGVAARFTFGPEAAAFPIWSPDGQSVAYADGAGSLFVKDAAGASAPRPLRSESGRAILTSCWSPDGTTIATYVQNPKTGWDVALLPAAGGEPTYFVQGPGNDAFGRFSPDGRWLAYVSDETGRNELYAVPYPGGGGKWQISTGGALAGWWLGQREIAWVTEGAKSFAAEIGTSGATLEIGPVRPLFAGRSLRVSTMDFAPDGRRLLEAVSTSDAAQTPLTLVQNWEAAIAAR